VPRRVKDFIDISEYTSLEDLIRYLETIRDNTQRKRLNFCLGLFRGTPIGQDARQVDYFCDPATVFLLFKFHAKLHRTNLTPFRSG